MLKPHVDVADDSWRGHITPENTAAWFRAYTDFIIHYAKIADAYGVEMLAIGTELKSVSGNDYRSEWDYVISRIREVYSGILTYAANWDNYSNVCFWDRLDLLGIDAYVPVSSERNPSLEELVSGWSRWVEEVSTFQKSVRKDVIFTEIGYRSTDYAARDPWDYHEQRPINQALQARCYQAVMEAFREKSWFKGVFFWNWLPRKDAGGKFNTDFTPQHKLAEDIFRE
jgi:hypothetical protein